MSNRHEFDGLYLELANLSDPDRAKVFKVSQEIAVRRSVSHDRAEFRKQQYATYVKELRHNLRTLEEQVASQGWNTKYFHFRHLPPHGHPLGSLGATTCLILGPDNSLISRGIAIVSPLDNPRKDEGRLRSLVRAIAAIENETVEDPISRASARNVLSKCVPGFTEEAIAWQYKTYWHPRVEHLSPLEQFWYMRRQNETPRANTQTA